MVLVLPREARGQGKVWVAAKGLAFPSNVRDGYGCKVYRVCGDLAEHSATPRYQRRNAPRPVGLFIRGYRLQERPVRPLTLKPTTNPRRLGSIPVSVGTCALG